MRARTNNTRSQHHTAHHHPSSSSKIQQEKQKQSVGFIRSRSSAHPYTGRMNRTATAVARFGSFCQYTFICSGVNNSILCVYNRRPIAYIVINTKIVHNTKCDFITKTLSVFVADTHRIRINFTENKEHNFVSLLIFFSWCRWCCRCCCCCCFFANRNSPK